MTTQNKDPRERFPVRLHKDVKARLEYWADRRGYSSANEYVVDAIVEKIRRENQDYDLPTLEIARLNQVVDEMRAMSINVANLERVITSGFDSLIGLTRGDNYLLDAEDGELDVGAQDVGAGIAGGTV
jgi:predicted DNA-binding protein